MQVSIPLQELLDTYKKSNALYLCHHVMNVLHISFFKNDSESVVERNVKDFFAKYFKLAENAGANDCTIPLWFMEWNESNNRDTVIGWVHTTSGVTIQFPPTGPYDDLTKDIRMILLRHIQQFHPDAVLNFVF
jgi:hypothetical protein